MVVGFRIVVGLRYDCGWGEVTEQVENLVNRLVVSEPVGELEILLLVETKVGRVRLALVYEPIKTEQSRS